MTRRRLHRTMETILFSTRIKQSAKQGNARESQDFCITLLVPNLGFGLAIFCALKKHSLGHSEPGAQKHSKSTPWGTFRHGLRSPPPSTEPKTRKTRKVSKKSPERSLGPPDPGPRKSPKKVRKVKKIVDFQTFSCLFGLFWDFFGVWGRGVPNSSRETFLRLFGLSGFSAL